MLNFLLLRDWKLHKDALLLVGLIVLLMVPLGFLDLPRDEARFLLPMFGRVAFGLGCLLPFLVHFRELQQGTFGDLLTLPIARCELVNLRWAEAGLCSVGFFVLVTLPGLHQLTLRELVQAHASCTLPWIFLWVFAAQLPSQLRFGQKGGLSFGITMFLVEGWAAANMPAEELAKADPIMQKIIHVLQFPQRAWAALGAGSLAMEILLLGLLFWAAYYLANRAAERSNA